MQWSSSEFRTTCEIDLRVKLIPRSIWVHTVIVDIFRPFVSKYLTLRSFAGTTDNTPDAIYEASLTQLQRLVVEYWQSQPAARYSLLWHVRALSIKVFSPVL